MKELDFKMWAQSGNIISDSTLRGYITNIRRVEKCLLLDIDDSYDRDRCHSIIDILIDDKALFSRGTRPATDHLKVEKLRDPGGRLGDIISALKKYVSFRDSEVLPPRSFSKTVSNQKAKNNKVVYPPLLLPEKGADLPANNVRYADDVGLDERVPGLCQFLEYEYDCIIDFLLTYIVRDVIDFDNLENMTFNDLKIRVILSKETPLMEPIITTPEYRARRIESEINKKKGTLSYNRILEIEKETIVDRVTGRYYPSKYGTSKVQGHIEIYYKNFTADSLEEYFAEAAMVLAHEFMHYVHHCLLGDSEFYSNGKHVKRVKEAVADFFGMLYSLHSPMLERFDLAHKRYGLWEERASLDWPYRYALYFFISNGREYDFAKDILDYMSVHIPKLHDVLTKDSIKEAYNILIQC